MKGQVGMQRSVGRLVAPVVIIAVLLGTAWTGRAAVAGADIDPALRAGDVALIQVAAGTAWTVAADLTSAGATEVSAFDNVDVVTARVSETTLGLIASDRHVLRATTDANVVASGGGRNDKDLDRYGDLSDRTSVGVAAVGAPSAWPRSTGAGVVVALMDSGIGNHPDLPAGKVVARKNFVADNATSLDPAGHGTHLAGVIAANGETFRGVAPDARLVDIRVLDANGVGTLKNVVAGFDWLLKNRRALHIGVLNLSIGTPQIRSYHSDLLAALAEAAWFSGVTVVAAAGNDGPLPGGIATPGADPFVITVGSLDDQGTLTEVDDRESAFSSRGPTLDGFAKPDVLAPGRRVVSLRADGSALDKSKPVRVAALVSPETATLATAAATLATSLVTLAKNRDTRDNNGNGSRSDLYVRMSGTSVSSAMVAGTAALVLSYHREYSPTKIKGAIVGSAHRVLGSVTRAVDAQKALNETTRGVNSNLLPSKLLMKALAQSGVGGSGTTWEGITWEGVTWESVTWESVSWEAVTWEGVVWESVSWEGVMWESAGWVQPAELDASR
jgi:serine protease AprX